MNRIKPEDLKIIGIDIDQQIEIALVDEISKSIDKAIINRILNLKKKKLEKKRIY
jgi:hypothetical protein